MRRELIKKIQEKRESKVIVYFTGDRQPVFASTSIAEDAVRPLYEHLLSLGKNEKIDLYLYSRGGDVSVPWRIITMLREFCNELSVLIPYKAHSAATLISLGADTIIAGIKAELGPIDPTLTKMTAGEIAGPPQEISVEDVNSFISFIKEKANINDQSAIAQLVCILANNLNPLTLGSVNRQNSHIRLVARKLLTSRKEKIDEEKINSIVETLTEKMYSHGHAIGRVEALEIGLPIIKAEKELETLMWKLFLEYERELKLDEPIDSTVILTDKENEKLQDVPGAIIESENKLHVVKSTIELKKKRKDPPNPQLNINLNLQMPPSIDPKQIPQEAQNVLQQIMNQLRNDLPRLIQEQLIRQSPEVGLDVRVYGGRWIEIAGEEIN